MNAVLTSRALAPVIVLALIAAAPVQSRDEAAVLRSYFSGNGLLNRGMYELAAAEYRQFLEAYPEHDRADQARYGLSVALFRMGEHEPAVAELTRLRGVDRFAYAADVLMILGQSYMALGRPPEAIDCFREVATAHAQHEHADEAAAMWAEGLYKARRYDEVEQPCQLLTARWPQSPLRERAELVWGLSETARGRHQEAAERFAEMVQRFPSGQYADQVALLLAQSLHRADAPGLAERQYRAVIARGRDAYVPDALYGLAVLLHAGGQPEPAGELADRLLDEYPRDELVVATRLLRGRIWFDLGQYERAAPLFDQVAATRGDHRDDAAYWRAKCRLRQGDAGAAAEAFAAAAREFAESDLLPQILYDQAVAQVRAGEADEAIEVLETFRRRYPRHELAPDALQLMASTRHQQQRYGDSQALCAEFLQRYPDHALAPACMFLAAENEFLTQDFEAAREAYLALLDAHPDHVQAEQARFRLGMSLYKLGRYGIAEGILREFARGEATPPEYRAALLAVGDGHFQREQWAEAEVRLREYLAAGDPALADDALLKLGLALQRQEEDAAALAVFDTLIDAHQDSPHLHHAVFERGQVLVALGRGPEAKRAFEQVLAEAPESRFVAHAHNHLGAIALQDRRYDDAARHFAAAAGDLDAAAAAEALFQQGQALMSAQRFEPAEQVLRSVLQTAPRHKRAPEATALAAIARARRQTDGTALGEIERVQAAHAAALSPALRASLAYEKAWCLRRLGREDEARAAYTTVLETPGDVPLRDRATLELAELEIEKGDHARAAARLRELRDSVARSDTAPPELREHCTYQLGLCEFNLGANERAAELLEEFLDASPASDLVPSAHLLAGEALFRLGRHEQSAEHLDRVVDRYEGHDTYGPALLRRGEALAALQDWPRSEASFRTYLERMPDARLWFQARFGVGFAMENQGRYEAAIDAYREVVDRHEGPTAARAQFQIGECLFAARRFDEAVRELLKVDILYAYPEWSAPALYEAGRCFEELSDPAEARTQYAMVIERFGDTDWARLARQRLDALGRVRVPGNKQ